MWILNFAGTTAVTGLLYCYFQQRKTRNIKHIYAQLIALCQHIDKNCKIVDESRDSVTFELSNRRGSLLLILTQFHSILCVEIERINAENTIDNQEWYFLEDQNQNWMFHTLISGLIAAKSGVLKENVLLKLLDQASDFIADEENIFYSKQLTSNSLFAIAYANVRKFPDYKYINVEGRLEMLLFNCVFLLNQTSIEYKQQEFSNEMVSLLLFYLEKHQITNHIAEIEPFLDARFAFYSTILEQIITQNNPEYRELYYLFRIKPLSIKVKNKYKDIENNNFSESINNMVKNLQSIFNQYVTKVNVIDTELFQKCKA